MPESRREFFKHFTSQKTTKSPSISRENLENPLEKNTSRRDFIKALSVITAALAVGENLQAKENTSQPPNKTISPVPAPTEPGNKHEKEFSYDDTAIEQSLMIVAKSIVSVIFTKLGIEHGNKSIDEEKLMREIKEKPIEEYLEMVVAYPAVEELLFRALPSALISKSPNNENKKAWGVGITTSVLFAAIHNFSLDKDSPDDLKFITNSIPITQFMGGLFYWYLIRERGLSHSILAHSMQNTVAFTYFLLKSYPDKTKKGFIFEGKAKK